MTKILQYATYAAIISLLLMIPAAIYPQMGIIGLAVNFIYFGAGIIVYAGFAHIGKTTKNRLMKNAAHTIIAIIGIFVFFNILQNTPYKLTGENTIKETAMLLMLPQVIYGLAVMGLGISIVTLEKQLGKTAAITAIAYTITGAFYSTGWILNEATTAIQPLPEVNASLILTVLKIAIVVSIFAQAATIIFLHKADKELK